MALVPKDVRGARDFELVKGTDEMLRTSVPMDDPDNDSFDVGEFVGVNAAGNAIKVTATVVTAPEQAAKLCWTKYVPADTNNGQTDALGTKTVDLVSGTFQAKTKLVVPDGTPAPGELLVVILNGGIGKVTNVVGTPANLDQVRGAVGKVLNWDATNLVLWFESNL